MVHFRRQTFLISPGSGSVSGLASGKQGSPEKEWGVNLIEVIL